jgi:hypothetical protein
MGVKVFISGEDGDPQVGGHAMRSQWLKQLFQTQNNGQVILTRLQELGVSFVKVGKNTHSLIPSNTKNN